MNINAETKRQIVSNIIDVMATGGDDTVASWDDYNPAEAVDVAERDEVDIKYVEGLFDVVVSTAKKIEEFDPGSIVDDKFLGFIFSTVMGDLKMNTKTTDHKLPLDTPGYDTFLSVCEKTGLSEDEWMDGLKKANEMVNGENVDEIAAIALTNAVIEFTGKVGRYPEMDTQNFSEVILAHWLNEMREAKAAQEGEL